MGRGYFIFQHARCAMTSMKRVSRCNPKVTLEELGSIPLFPIPQLEGADGVTLFAGLVTIQKPCTPTTPSSPDREPDITNRSNQQDHIPPSPDSSSLHPTESNELETTPPRNGRAYSRLPSTPSVPSAPYLRSRGGSHAIPDNRTPSHLL